jgi:transposase
MTTTRKQYTPKFKAKVALEAIRGERTLTQLASQYHVHPIQVGQWRKTAQEQLAELFVDGRKRKRRDEDIEKDALYEQIGRLKVELDWLKKSWSARLSGGASWWISATARSACGGSASCWA